MRKITKIIPLLLFAAMLINLTACTSESTSNPAQKVESAKSEKENTASDSADTEEKELVFKKGETASQNDVEVTMTKVTESKGSDFVKPEKGKIFVLAEFLIENKSGEEINISSVMSSKSYIDGYSVDTSLSAEMDHETLDGSIAPGKKLKGVLGYEADKKYKELEIHLQLDVWDSGNKIKFVYKK